MRLYQLRLRPQIRLRTALAMLALVCAGVAYLSSYAINRDTQRKIVRELVVQGGTFQIGRGSVDYIQVWYDDKLEWSESEGRYTFVSSFATQRGIKNWVGENLGKDYVDSPVAIEIIKFDFSERPLLDPAIIANIRRLPSVRQIAIRGFIMNDEKVPRDIVDDFIKTTFPNLVNASPQ